LSNFVVWSYFYCSFFCLRLFSLRNECFKFNLFMFHKTFKVVNDFFSILSKSFAMPILLVLNFGEILAFKSISHNYFRLSIFLFQLLKGWNDLIVIMSIDDMSFPSKSLEFSSDCLDIIPMHCLLRLTESVNINDSDEIVKFVVSTKVNCLPNASFCDLTIPANAKYGVIDLIEILARISHTACDRKSLAQRSSCDINKWNLRNWMAFNYGVFKSQ
jgi:hypothetical protein